MICAQTRVPGVSVSQVARRYDVNANQVFNWLKEPRFADAKPADREAVFLPVETIKQQDMTVANVRADPVTLEIDLACGHRFRINGPYDGDALARLIRGLSS